MKKKLIIFLLPLAMLISCVDSLIEDGYNIDKKNASTVPPETLFTNALKNFSDILTTPNVNNNNFRLYVQHWATTTYLQEPRYDMTSRTIPQALWQAMYRDVIADLKEAKTLLEEDELMDATEKANQIAQSEILEVYAWSVLVNAFGDIPYSEAFTYEIPLPKYDDAETVYNDILARLDGALAMLDAGAKGFEDGDLLYEGDIAQWVKFGNSLKLKLAMIVADVNPSAGALVAEAAPNVFKGLADNASFPYISSPPNNNPLSANLNPLYSQRQDYVMAAALVDSMNAYNDPRREFYFTDVEGEYIGGKYGFLNAYPDFSHVSEVIIDPELEAVLLGYDEVEFYLAEAVERGFIGGDASEHYNNAISASIEYWTGAPDGNYLTQEDVVYSSEDYKKLIGVQKWIALYNRGFDAWTEWRRLDYPNLLPPSEADGAPAGLQVPVRMIYPINEQTLNGAARAAAADAIGGDVTATKLFWDVN